jgi:flavin reductase (DIM6/NTAB) family NADH-FMN oxidoreductase RutF
MPAMHETVGRWLAQLDYPMFVVTAHAAGERAGCLVGFATQCSIHPTRVLICLSEKNRTYRVAQQTDVLAVHAVPAEREDLAELFGSQTGDEVDKFAGCAWREGPAGVPIVSGCDNWFAGRVLARLGAGDHQAVLLEPFEGGAGEDVSQFNFHRAKRIEPGHAP